MQIMENSKNVRVISANASDIEENSVRKHHSWKPFLKQLFICSGTWVSQFMYGLCVGSPTVFIPQIRREANSTSVISEDMASWLTSVFSFSGFPWVIILAILTKYYGRKIPYILTMVQTFIAFLVFYCSTSVNHILISLGMLGLLSASQIVISFAIATEYISPRYRGALLGAASAMFYWGIFSANTIGTFAHWKNIGLLGIACSSLNLLASFFWPESPYWLATQGKYKQCAKTHQWLKGYDAEAVKELEVMIKTQKEYVRNNTRTKLTPMERIKNVYYVMTARTFYKPLFLAFVSGLVGVFSGKLVCTVYAIDIIKKITQNESTAYTGMLILDAITIISMYLGCIIARYVKRKTLFLNTAAIGVFFLFTMSLYLYLIKLNVIIENNYASLGLLTLFSIAISAGPMIVATSVIAELIPIRSRNLATCTMAIMGKIIMGCVLKISPTIFKAFEIHGTFLFFGIASLVCIYLLYKYLPETKDKTLQEIEESMRGKDKLKNETVEVTENLVSTQYC